MSHDSAQFSPSFSLAKEAEIEYNPHVFWRGLRGFFSLPPRSGFVQPWNANNPPLRSGLSTFLFLLEVLRGGYGGAPDVSAGWGWSEGANGAEQKAGLSRSQARFEGLIEVWEAGQGLQGQARSGTFDL